MDIKELRQKVKAMGGKLTVHKMGGGMRKLALTIHGVKFETSWFDAAELGDSITSVDWKASAVYMEHEAIHQRPWRRYGR